MLQRIEESQEIAFKRALAAKVVEIAVESRSHLLHIYPRLSDLAATARTSAADSSNATTKIALSKRSLHASNEATPVLAQRLLRRTSPSGQNRATRRNSWVEFRRAEQVRH